MNRTIITDRIEVHTTRIAGRISRNEFGAQSGRFGSVTAHCLMVDGRIVTGATDGMNLRQIRKMVAATTADALAAR